MPLRLEEREPTRAFWRSHFEVWELSGLTQQEYCERHGLNLKNFGNWRGQLKREAAVGAKARWGRYPRLRPGDSHMANPMAKARATRAPVKRALPPLGCCLFPHHLCKAQRRRALRLSQGRVGAHG